jgi:hypothetical protein
VATATRFGPTLLPGGYRMSVTHSSGREGPLQTTVVRDQQSITVTCAGSAETATVDQFEQVLGTVHVDALRTGVTEVVVDLRDLEFATSSCLKALATWLHLVQQLEPPAQYRVRFRSNPRHSWQRRSLGALATFAAEVVEIDLGAA